MDSEKGNRVFARGHNVPPLGFWSPKKSLVWIGLRKVLPYSAFSYIFSKTLFDFKKSISGRIQLKFSRKTLNSILYVPIYFWVSIFSLRAKF